MDVVREHRVAVDPSIMVCVVTALVLEGWQFRLDPNLSMIDHINEMISNAKRVESLLEHFSLQLYRSFDQVWDVGCIFPVEAATKVA